MTETTDPQLMKQIVSLHDDPVRRKQASQVDDLIMKKLRESHSKLDGIRSSIRLGNNISYSRLPAQEESQILTSQ